MTAAQKLLARRLKLFGVNEQDAIAIANTGRISHRFGPRRYDIEHCNVSRRDTGLQQAEHAARVWHNWNRCYHVNTTHLAMNARAA